MEPFEPELSDEIAEARGSLRNGWTTGTCASAAAKAAVIGLLKGVVPPEVEVVLPKGERMFFPVTHQLEAEANAVDDPGNSSVNCSNDMQVSAVVIKDAGDDPDCTDGARMTACVRWLNFVETQDAVSELNQRSGGVVRNKGTKVVAAPGSPAGIEWIRMVAGSGVGTITKPGLGLEVGDPAINPVPTRMIVENVAEALVSGAAEEESISELEFHKSVKVGAGRRQKAGDGPVGLEIVFSVPGGEAMAEKTTNDRLGIVGGISILGTTGIVKPFSTAAYRSSVVQQIEVAKAQGESRIVLCTGYRTERLAFRLRPELDKVCIVEVGDFTGIALRKCASLGIGEVLFVGMAGKIAKLAQGIMMTHYRRSIVDVELMARAATESGAAPTLVKAATETTTARHFAETCVSAGNNSPLELMCKWASRSCEQFTDHKLPVEVVMSDFDGETVLASSFGN